VSVRLVVEVKHVALRVKLRRVGAIVLDRIDMWKGFHAELAIEAAAERVENLVFLLCAVPYYMHR
jgi:hypothetical protein